MARNKSGTSIVQWIFIQFIFLLVIMVAPLFAIFLVTTESGFRGYVYQGDVNKALAYAPILEKEFEKNGTWESVVPLLSQAPFSYHAASGVLHSDHSALENSQDFEWIRERIVILDTQRRVIVDSKHVLMGTNHPSQHLKDAVTLKNKEGWTIGYLLVGTMVDPALTQNHEAFLNTTATTLIVLFLVSLALVVPLAIWLGSRIAKPLKKLVQRTERASAGDWNGELTPHTPREVRALDEAFQKLSQNLQASEDRKARLLADATHELRTPLTVVRGTLEAILDGVFPMDKATLESVYSETLRLEKIVESLRQLEDLHSKPVQGAPFDWAAVVSRVEDLFKAQARKRRQVLLVQCPPELKGWGEVEAIHQILVNLVSNALRHAPGHGTVLVEVSAAEQEIVVAVEDNGPGVSEADRHRIFERFVRLDPSRSEKTGGRGLGLAIVKQLVERHKGTVQVVDSNGPGARFEVRFPLKPFDPQ